MHGNIIRNDLAVSFVGLAVLLSISGLTAHANMLGLRYGGEARAKNSLKMGIDDADVILCGKIVQLVEETEGSATNEANQAIQGCWYKVKFKINNVIKGKEEGKDVIVRFFSPSHGGSNIYPLPLDKSACLLFLKKSTNALSTLTIAPSRDPVLSLPDSPVNLTDVSSVEGRMRTVLVNAVETGDGSFVSLALEMALLLMDKDDRSALLQRLSKKQSYASKGVILAYRLSLGDWDAGDMIDTLLAGKNCSEKESDAIASAVEELEDTRCIPFLLKWISCGNNTVSRSAYAKLVTFEDRSLVPIMIAALDHDDTLLRLRALTSLSKIVGPRKRGGEVVTFTRENSTDAVNLWKQWWTEKGKKEMWHVPTNSFGNKQ